MNLLAAPRMALEVFSDMEVRTDGRPEVKVWVRWDGRKPEAVSGWPVFVC